MVGSQSISIILFIIYISIQLKHEEINQHSHSLPIFNHHTHPRKYIKTYSEPQLVDTKSVKLRGVHIKSTANDSPNLIFFPEAFDQV